VHLPLCWTTYLHSLVAQSAERHPVKVRVGGSSPPWGAMYLVDEDPEVLMASVTKDEVVNCLVGAYNMISKGWCRKNFKRGDRHCLVGGIAASAGLSFSAMKTGETMIVDTSGNEIRPHLVYPGDHETHVYRNAVEEVERMWRYQGLDSVTIWEWNDAQTTKRPVLQLIQDTIEELNA
jgi:hypothetical protein